MSYDVTFCVSDCKNVKCEYHRSKIPEAATYTVYVATADRSETCESYKR